MHKRGLAPIERATDAIQVIGGQRVIVDADLAPLYGVTTRELVQAVKRNAERFPPDFMFQLSAEEARGLRSQFVISKRGRGGRRTAPYAFTEHGVTMLSSVLRSSRAVSVNIAVVRAFIRLRRALASNEVLRTKLDALEEKYDDQFTVVFRAIRKLMAPPAASRRPIGFRSLRR